MLKDNINKLDYQLKAIFDNVSIVEKSNKSDYYFDIKVEKLSEGKKVAVRFYISKPQLENNNTVTWRYLSDTNDENSFIIERVSSLEDLVEDIDDIIINRKLDREYLESLETSVDNDSESIDEQDNSEGVDLFLVEMLKNMDVEHLETRSVFEDNVLVELAHFKHSLKPSDKKRVEMALESAGYNNILWNNDRLFVKYYL